MSPKQLKNDSDDQKQDAQAPLESSPPPEKPNDGPLQPSGDNPPQEPANPPQQQSTVMPKTPPTGMRYAMHPVNNSWQNAAWFDNAFGSGRPGIQFSDSSFYDVAANCIQFVPLEPTQPQQEDTQKQTSQDVFKNGLLALERGCQELFELPLEVFLVMVRRNANLKELTGTGHMAVYGGVAQFTPDNQTLSTWIDGYMQEVEERRKANMPDPEM